MEIIKANFIALKSGSGIHQFLGKISNQGEVQIASYKMNPLEYPTMEPPYRVPVPT